MQLDIYFTPDFPSVCPIVSIDDGRKLFWLNISWSLKDFQIDSLAKRLKLQLDVGAALFQLTEKFTEPYRSFLSDEEMNNYDLEWFCEQQADDISWDRRVMDGEPLEAKSDGIITGTKEENENG